MSYDKEESEEVQIAENCPKRDSISNSSSISAEEIREKRRDLRNLNKLKAYYGISNDELLRFETFLQNAEKLSKKLGENMTVKEIENTFNSTRDSMISKYLRRCKENYHKEITETKDESKEQDNKRDKASKVMGFKEEDKPLVEKIKKAVIVVDEEEEDAIKYVKKLNFKE